MPELDHALEWCENEIIAQHQGLEQEEASLRDWFTQILGQRKGRRRELMHRCERIEVDAGETIVRAGDAADSMHFILDGRVGIMVPAPTKAAPRGCAVSAATPRSARWAWSRRCRAAPPSRPKSPASFTC